MLLELGEGAPRPKPDSKEERPNNAALLSQLRSAKGLVGEASKHPLLLPPAWCRNKGGDELAAVLRFVLSIARASSMDRSSASAEWLLTSSSASASVPRSSSSGEVRGSPKKLKLGSEINKLPATTLRLK